VAAPDRGSEGEAAGVRTRLRECGLLTRPGGFGARQWRKRLRTRAGPKQFTMSRFHRFELLTRFKTEGLECKALLS
jgi:hypothetical protein